MDLKNINDNIISRRWKERYATLSEETKEKLSAFKKMNPSEYQLQVIKRKRIYPEIGDIFELKTRHNVVIKGIVVNNHINNINGDDLLLVLIFKPEVDIRKVQVTNQLVTLAVREVAVQHARSERAVIQAFKQQWNTEVMRRNVGEQNFYRQERCRFEVWI